MRRQRLTHAFLFIFFFSFFVYRSAVFLDPDFGWHLQFGRLLLQTHSFSLTDPYSYTMPSYRFVDHEWGMDLLIATIYDACGMWPLVVLFSCIGIGTLFVLWSVNKSRWGILLLFLICGTLFEFIGVRPQVVTWFFLAILTGLLFETNAWQRFRFFVPFLFLLWANLHGGFAIGIVIFGISLLGQMLEKHHVDREDLFVFVFSLFATLCNPYGYHLWTEVIKSATDPTLRWAIQEWYPAIYFSNIAFWVYVALSVFLILRFYQRFSLTMLVIYGLLLFAGLASMRNIPIFMIYSFYQTLQAIHFLKQDAEKVQFGKIRFVKAYTVFFILCLFLFLPQLGAFVYGVFVLRENQNSYPASAISYLQKHLPKEQLFFSYDWGGYFIWQLPQKKVFIDGRMPSWRNSSAAMDESTYAFGEYQKILENQEPFSAASKKYKIDTLVISPNDLHEPQGKIFGIALDKSVLLKRFFGANLSFSSVVSQAKKMGWRKVYHDQTAVIFEKQTL